MFDRPGRQTLCCASRFAEAGRNQMAFGFLQRGSLSEHARQAQLSSYQPCIQLERLMRGVDNIRHDVALSARFMEVTRQHIFRLITKYGQIDLLLEDSASQSRPPSRVALPGAIRRDPAKSGEANDFKRALHELHMSALNRAKADNNTSIDLLGRLAAIKFKRNEMSAQFAQALERCRAQLKAYEGPRQLFANRAVEVRERVER